MIAGCGFAGMAWELACLQANQSAIMVPLDRTICAGWGQWSPSANYYRIIDRATDDFAWATRYAPSHCMRIYL